MKLYTETCNCGGKFVATKPSSYQDKNLGLSGVFLHGGVEVGICEACGAEGDISFRAMSPMIERIAEARVYNPRRLNGEAIYYLWRAVHMTREDVARSIDIHVDDLKAAEEDKISLTPQAEKLFRILIGMKLPDPEKITRTVLSMDLQSVGDKPYPEIHVYLGHQWNMGASIFDTLEED